MSWYQRLSPARRAAYSRRVNAAQRRLRATRVAAGLCVTCEAPAAVRNGRRILRCDGCADSHNAARRISAA